MNPQRMLPLFLGLRGALKTTGHHLPSRHEGKDRLQNISPGDEPHSCL